MIKEYKGIYHLIATDGFDREYFNFEGTRDFVPEEWVTMSGVKLAYIDAITTLFRDDKDFRCSLNKGIDDERRLSIVYVANGSKAKFERKLDPVFDNEELNKIATAATKTKSHGTEINLEDETTKKVLNRIFQEIQCRGSDFSYEACNSSLVNHQLSDYSKEKISQFHHNTAYLERNYNYQFRLFTIAFKSYKEFRALYLNYVAYKNNLYRGTEIPKKASELGNISRAKEVEKPIVSAPTVEEKAKVKVLDKKKETRKRKALEQCEGQLSMFPLIEK